MSRRNELELILQRVEHRFDRAVPFAVKAREQFFRRRFSALDDLLDRIEEIALVLAGIIIEPAAAFQPVARERNHVAREPSHLALADRRVEALTRHLVAKLLALLRAPALDEIPGRVERQRIVEKAGP